MFAGSLKEDRAERKSKKQESREGKAHLGLSESCFQPEAEA